MTSEEFFARIAELLGEGRAFATARLLACEGSVPQSPGAGMIVHSDGTIESTIGGGPFEADVIKDARELLSDGRILHKRYEITRNNLGMYCAGRAEVLIEAFPAAWQLWIFGGGHIGQALGQLAGQTRLFRTSVFDDRPEFAAATRHPTVDDAVHTDLTWTHGLGVPSRTTCVVIATRCHETDRMLVARLAASDAAYVGMIGSETKRATMMKELAEEGVPTSALERVETPAGLPIGGKSPMEVALSILARVVQIRNNADRDRRV